MLLQELSVLRWVLARTSMKGEHILLDTATERLCDTAAAEDFVLAGVHFDYKLVDAETWAWKFPAFSAILRQER